MRKLALIVLFIGLTIITLLNLSKSQNQENEINVPENIILFIGDGMGPSQVSAGKTAKGTLNLEKFKTTGLVTTYSEDNYVTDSAASGTALATGHKTYNGAIGVDMDKKPLKTLLEYADEQGKSLGLVTTCAMTHATPAAFVSHVEKRSMQNEIAQQIAKFNLTVLFGGGWGYFVPQSVMDSRRHDDMNLLDSLRTHMQVATSPEEYQHLNESKPAAAMLYVEHPPEAAEREITLTDLTAKAIRILSHNHNGFVLMVEGSQIDWAGHDNQDQRLIREVVDFDDAVGAGLEFAQKDGNTLVVVTADHETGGFSVLDGSIADRTVTKTAFTTGSHSGVMVPIFAYGPGSSAFAGIQDNTNIGKTLIQYVLASPETQQN